MAQTDSTIPGDSAEKAFAAAVEASVSPLPVAKPQPEPIAAAKPAAIVQQAPAEKPVAAKPVTVKAEPVAAAPAVAKPAPAKAAKPAKRAKSKAALAKRSIKPAAKAAPKSKPIVKIKDTIMATKKTPDFTGRLKAFAADAQKQAKAAYAKGSAVLSDAGEFTKGNAEALVESGKILATGAQSLGKTYVAEAKTAVETAQADVKALAAVRSPVDFVKLQGDILRRNTESAFAFTSRNNEAVLKLASDVFAPISGRFSLAVQKIKQAA